MKHRRANRLDIKWRPFVRVKGQNLPSYVETNWTVQQPRLMPGICVTPG